MNEDKVVMKNGTQRDKGVISQHEKGERLKKRKPVMTLPNFRGSVIEAPMKDLYWS